MKGNVQQIVPVSANHKILIDLVQDMRDEADWNVLCRADPDKKHWVELQFSATAMAAGQEVIAAWCRETFGQGYFVFSSRVMFDQEQDAELFILRWL